MLNRLIKTTEAITTAVLNRFVSFDHNIDGSQRTHIDARNYASMSAAIDACGAAGSKSCTIAITNNQAVSSNKTVLPHVTLWFVNSGRITFSGGAVLTVQGGMLEMGLQQRFFGTGTVVFDTGFIERVYPQWWGAKGDGATEDTTAIQAAIAATSTNNLAVHCVAGNYVIDALTLPVKTNLQGDGSALTKLTRKSGAAGRGMDATADADDIILKGFELDCDFEGTDGIRLGLSGSGAWGESGTIEDVKVRDCAGIGVHLSTDRANIRQLSIINANAGGVGTHQLKLEGDNVNIYDLRITGETGTTANIEFTGSNINMFGTYLEDPHLTKPFRFVGDNNTMTGLNIVTEDNTKTYTQLFYFETNAIENRVRDVHIIKGASDTITNIVQDDKYTNTISFSSEFDRYSQHDVSFRVTASGQQAIPTGATTKITAWDTTAFDIHSSFDLANDRFIPTSPGVYFLYANIGFPGGSAIPDQGTVQVHIYENGGSYAINGIVAGAGSKEISLQVSALIQANGSTDEYDVRVFHDKGTDASTATGISFQAFKVK